MTDAPNGLLALNTYQKSQSNMRRLRESLPDDVVASLAQEVIRRLASREQHLEHVPHDPSAEDIETLCAALISTDDSAAARIIDRVNGRGTPAEVIYLKHLAAAARMLGEWWVDDRANFMEVTVASGRMFSIMRSMRHLFMPPPGLQDKAAIFASVPGENHTLGVRMAADLLRSEGWDISLKLHLDHDELVADIERTPSRIIGLSIGGRHSVDTLSRLVVALHICCPGAALIVCGQDIDDIRRPLSLMGLDGIATDLEDAKQQMTALWNRRPNA